jgi:hypothetical protein
VSASFAPPPEILAAFALDQSASADPLPGGHIHTAFTVARDDAEPVVLQRLNTFVFPDPARVARNTEIVTATLRDQGVLTLEFVTARDGQTLALDHSGRPWRAYVWVEGRVADPRRNGDAEIVAQAFGVYAAALRGLDPTIVPPTIVDFHDLDRRVHAFVEAIGADRADRLSTVSRDIDRCRRALSRVTAVRELDSLARAPRRVAHHDAKPANAVVRMDGRVCVIDLDTTMAGTVLSDVGELIRSCTWPAAEDDETAAPALQPERVGRVVAAWVSGWGGALHPAEREGLVIAGIVRTLENAVRFLTDHLDGDRYFYVSEPQQNLARFRAQLAHAQVQLDAYDDLRRSVEHELRGLG